MCPIMIVYPSGVACAPRVVPVVPPAPVTFSTTICWPSERDMVSPPMRATTWVGPPGAKGTFGVMGRSGYAACPWNAGGAESIRIAFFMVSPWVLRKPRRWRGGSFGEDLRPAPPDRGQDG